MATTRTLAQIQADINRYSCRNNKYKYFVSSNGSRDWSYYMILGIGMSTSSTYGELITYYTGSSSSSMVIVRKPTTSSNYSNDDISIGGSVTGGGFTFTKTGSNPKLGYSDEYESPGYVIGNIRCNECGATLTINGGDINNWYLPAGYTTSISNNYGIYKIPMTHNNTNTVLVTELNQAKARDSAIVAFDNLNLSTAPNNTTAAEAKRQLDIILTNAGSSYEGYTSRLAKYNTYVANLSTTEQLNISVGSLRAMHTNISSTMLPGKVSRYTDIHTRGTGEYNTTKTCIEKLLNRN